ncbi:MAG: hypothetical protein ACR5LG_01040 [Sodalis sp. (in: enterobacteria)]|uniref:hypothetical protein n=1 Tax=Sodalis sp. (in: enterobacteria) TaxID=1898979 RepID=UPI003F3922CF
MTPAGEQLELSQSVTRAQSLSLTAIYLVRQKGIMWQPGTGEIKMLVSGEADNRGGGMCTPAHCYWSIPAQWIMPPVVS